VDEGDLLEEEDHWGVLQGLGARAVFTLEVRVLDWARAVPTTDHFWETVELPPSVWLYHIVAKERRRRRTSLPIL
jgi:hypothetical protein